MLKANKVILRLVAACTILVIMILMSGQDRDPKHIFKTDLETDPREPIRENQSAESILKELYNITTFPAECHFCIGGDGLHFHTVNAFFQTVRKQPECLSGHSKIMRRNGSSGSGVAKQILQYSVNVSYPNNSLCTKADDTNGMVDSLLMLDGGGLGGHVVMDPSAAKDMRLFSQFAREQLGVPLPSTEVEQGDGLRVALVERKHAIWRGRKFWNVSALQRILESPAENSQHHFEVDVFTLRGTMADQIGNLTHPQPTFIIMAHGSGVTNLMFLDPVTASRTTVIEICPPYTHCDCYEFPLPGNSTVFSAATMCPYFFAPIVTSYLPLDYWGYAVEDKELDCEQFCIGNANKDNHSFVFKQVVVRDVPFVTVSGVTLRAMMNQILKMKRDGLTSGLDIKDRIMIHKMDLSDWEAMWGGNFTVRGPFTHHEDGAPYADVSKFTGRAAIQPRDMTMEGFQEE